MSNHFTPAPTSDFDLPWESTQDSDPYRLDSELLQTFDQEHYPAIHKPEGGPFYGDYDGPETITRADRLESSLQAERNRAVRMTFELLDTIQRAAALTEEVRNVIDAALLNDSSVPQAAREKLIVSTTRLDSAVNELERAKADLGFALWRTGEVMS